MDVERVPFDKIIQSLASLSEEELFRLERLLWDRQNQLNLDAELRKKRFSASATFSSARSHEQNLAFEAIQQAIQALNPAEVHVLHTLVTWHLDKSHHHEGSQTSTSWGTDNLPLSFSANTTWTFGNSAAQPAVDPELHAEKDAIFQEITQLLPQISAAKKAGELERAQNLVEETIQLAKRAGIPDYMLERIQEMYQ